MAIGCKSNIERKLTSGNNTGSKPCWSVTEAVLIGGLALSAYLTLSFLCVRAVKYYSVALMFSRFQLRELTTLICLAGTALILAAVVALIFQKKSLKEFLNSIEWNSGKSTFLSIIVGAVLAITWSAVRTAFWGGGGPFSDTNLVLDMFLYLATEVIVTAALEEMYFRGVLFSALTNAFGSAVAVGFTTILFILIHLGHQFNVLPAAIVLGVARQRTKSVASCFVLHASYNFFVFLYVLLKW